MKFSFEIEIDCSPEEVFYWLKDPEKAKNWMTSVSETEMLSGTPNTVGATFREVIEDANGKTEMRGMVTGYKENELISFHLSGQYNTVNVEFRLEKIGERTRVTQNAEVRFRSFMRILSIFLGPAFKRDITTQSQKEFAQLKLLCETKMDIPK
jgi:carbon monoxide dehydrogenase subunit G